MNNNPSGFGLSVEGGGNVPYDHLANRYFEHLCLKYVKS